MPGRDQVREGGDMKMPAKKKAKKAKKKK